MTTATIRKQLHTYLDVVNDKKVKAIYALLEEDIVDKIEVQDHWNDPAFVAEMNSRIVEIESGKVKGKSWDEVQNNARKSLTK